MKLISLLPLVIATDLENDRPLDLYEGPADKPYCMLYTKTASYMAQKAAKIADRFNQFGEYRDVALMTDLDQKEKDLVLEATFCNYLCDGENGEKSTFCSEMQRSLPLELLGKMALYQTLMKKNTVTITAQLDTAKTVANSVLRAKVGDLTEEKVEAILAMLYD